MERILDGLADAGIPFHSKEQLKSSIWPWMSMLLFRFMRPRPTMEFHVDVFTRDTTRAQEIVRGVEKADDLDFDDENEEQASAQH